MGWESLKCENTSQKGVPLWGVPGITLVCEDPYKPISTQKIHLKYMFQLKFPIKITIHVGKYAIHWASGEASKCVWKETFNPCIVQFMFMLVIYPALHVLFHFHQIVAILKVLKHFLNIVNIKKRHVFFGGHLFSMCFVASHPIGMPRILNMLSCHLGYGDEPESCGRMTCIPNLHQHIYPC